MLQITDYSTKAVAVIGTTKNYKDELRRLGGRFNRHLSCGAGWIFSRKALAELSAFVNRVNDLNGMNGTNGQGTSGQRAASVPEGAAVYVGTYHKYNTGSIAGAWLKLADYKDKNDFIRACRELHRDERDPELMFQDSENIPSWMISESSIDAELWNYKEPNEAAGTQTKAEIQAILERYNITSPAAKDLAAVVEIGDRLFFFWKQKIETRFCHPDEPEDEVREWWKVCKTWEFFHVENMGEFEREFRAEELEKGGEGLTVYASGADKHHWGWTDDPRNLWRTKDLEMEPMNAETRKALLKAYTGVKAAFEKRLKAWWKRYGAEKLYCWTYWRDA